jgi:hypothetical protein
MGTDITAYAEFCIPHELRWRPIRTKEGNLEDFGFDRNYDAFAIMANVRNGRGFAGAKTGEEMPPISEPRGFPIDASSVITAAYDDVGYHDHSHLTLQEILDYDWLAEDTKTGVIPIDEWQRWKSWNKGRGVSPTRYFGAIHGSRIRVVEAAEAQLLFDLKADLAGVHVRDEWKVPRFRAARALWGELVPRLIGSARRLGVPPTHIRAVFFFDS